MHRLLGFANKTAIRVVALAFALAGLASLTIASHAPIQDADVWWHLRVGDWIIANHAFPHLGVFSRTAGNLPWMAYSWGYEVLLSRAYAWFGLVGIAWYGVALVFLVAAVYFWTLFRLSNRFWFALLVSVLGNISYLFNILPRSAFFSMAFFSLVLWSILEAHQTSDIKWLYGLPVVFVFWANCHIQFVYGLFVIWLFTVFNFARPAMERLRWLREGCSSTQLSRAGVIGISALCTLATLLGPYSYRVYTTVFSYVTAKYPRTILQEQQPIDFKHPSDFVLVLLLLWCSAVVIRKRDELTFFRISMLVVGSVLGFRSIRDCWFLAISAGAFIAEASRKQKKERSVFQPHHVAAVVALSSLILLIVARNTGFNERGLDRTISSRYPVDASNFLRRHPVPGPIYNEFGWGGFLIWYLPQYPVAIDPRTDLYGDEIDFMTYRAASGDFEGDRFLKESRVVLLPRDLPLAQSLASNPQFRLIYQDSIAVVFIRN